MRGMEDVLQKPSITNLDKTAVDILYKLNSCEPWLVGGAIRNLMCGITYVRDLDIVVPDSNYSNAVSIASGYLGKAVQNRHGNSRFFHPNGVKIDLWSPGRFFCGYADLQTMLSSVDFTCNSAALSHADQFMSHVSACDDIENKILRPIESRWRSQSAVEYAHLIGRGVKFITEYGFSSVNKDLFYLALNGMDCEVLRNRYLLEKTTAHKILNGSML